MQRRILAKWVPYCFILPAVAYMLVFVGYPLVYNFMLGFRDVNITNISSGTDRFIGVANYVKLIQDDVFWIAVRNTAIFTIASVFFQFVFGFALALFFHLNFRLSSYLRGLLMVGWLLPITISALMFKFMMDSRAGILNEMLMRLHLISRPLDWLINTDMALWGVVITNIWVGIPFPMLLLSAGLNALPVDVYESASLDGANRIRKFINITVPLLRPVILVVLMLGCIFTFKVFDLIYIMTGGGPVNSTLLLSIYAYQLSFAHFDFGVGSAAANMLFILLFLVSLGYLKAIRKDEVI